MPRVLSGLGVAVVSTPKGVVTDKFCRENNVGGEVICFVW
jgi:small subunit ribosomal protein S8